MNLSKAKPEELIAELRRRGLLSARAASSMVNRMFGLESSKKEAERWVRLHPEIFAQMEAMALKLVAEGKRSSSRLMVETLRSEGDKVRIPNAITRHLNKMIVEKHPETRSLFRR